MKKFILLFFVLSAQLLFAQVSGKSKAGRLFQKENNPPKEIISVPRISIISPKIDNESFATSESNLIIHGQIEDESGIKSVSINQNYLGLLKNGEFFYELALKAGDNSVSIEAINTKDGKTSQNFSVKYIPAGKLQPEIILIEPKISAQNEVSSKEENLIIRGNVKNLNKSKLKINNMPVSLSGNGEFFYQLNLKSELTPVQIIAENNLKQSAELKFNVVYSGIKSVPIIKIIEPALPVTNELKHNETIITIRGKVEDIYEISGIKVNNQQAALLGANEFFANLNLNDGINNIVVTATNIKGISSEKLFKIITPVDDQGPEISILEPTVSRGLKIVRKNDVLNVRGKVIDRSGVLNVMVNNREVSLLPNKEFNTQLYLGMGDNTIIVKATDNKYNVSLDTFYVTRELEEVIKTGRYIALLIGIDSYSGYWHPLRNAVNDATELADLLKKQYYFNEVYTLLDKDATRKNIITKIEWMINNCTSDDNVLIFYAGHGQFIKSLNKGYWVPVDATSNSTADYISNNDIKTFIGGIPSRHTLLITDACFAGDIFRGGRTESIPIDEGNMTKYYREVYNKSSRLALTSGSLEQVSDAGKNNHSIFTYYLIKSLQENKQKYLDASQLFNDFRMAVTNNSDQTPQLQVVRDTNDEGGQFIFIKKD